MLKDDKIDSLIRPPVPKFVGFDWTQTWKLAPQGAAANEKIVASRLQPVD